MTFEDQCRAILDLDTVYSEGALADIVALHQEAVRAELKKVKRSLYLPRRVSDYDATDDLGLAWVKEYRAKWVSKIDRRIKELS